MNELERRVRELAQWAYEAGHLPEASVLWTLASAMIAGETVALMEVTAAFSQREIEWIREHIAAEERGS